MTEKEEMLQGRLYHANDGELMQARICARELVRAYNAAGADASALRTELLQRLFAAFGEGGYVEPRFSCDYGSNIHIGKRFYANFDCIILDVCRVDIGDDVMLGPRVCVYKAGHPVDFQMRCVDMLEYGAPVRIESGVWIGGNSVINPGVTIGARSVVGAGSLVTRDIPANVIAFGNPCRVFRKITAEDRLPWEEKKQRDRLE